MRLKLSRPIAFFDIESTGTDVEKDRIIDLAICKLHPDLGRTNINYRFNPTIPIPANSTAVHGISDDDVKDAPTFATFAQEIKDELSCSDIGGFNSNRFDLPLLMNEFRRAGIEWDYSQFNMIDAGNIFMIQEPRTLSAAVKFYCGHELINAHSAEADINATVDVFLAQLHRYPEVPATVEELHLFSNYGKPILDLSGKFTYNEAGDIIFNFGQYKGLIAEENVQYLDWMYYKASFPPDTRSVCESVYKIIKEKRDAARKQQANAENDFPF